MFGYLELWLSGECTCYDTLAVFTQSGIQNWCDSHIVLFIQYPSVQTNNQLSHFSFLKVSMHITCKYIAVEFKVNTEYSDVHILCLITINMTLINRRV